jgi:hypothetical protein
MNRKRIKKLRRRYARKERRSFVHVSNRAQKMGLWLSKCSKEFQITYSFKDALYKRPPLIRGSLQDVRLFLDRYWSLRAFW